MGSYPLDKSVFFRTQQGSDYGYGKGHRGQNTPNLDKGIFKTGADFETSEQRGEIGIIDIHVGDLLISGSAMFDAYISYRMEGDPKWIDMRQMGRPIWWRKSLK